MKVFRCEQGSEQWWRLRRGVPTASEFHRILTPKTCKPSASQEDYICELIADVLSLAPVYPSACLRSGTKEMQDGVDTEPEARCWFELERGVEVDRVGFCLTDDDRFGCSPDGLIGEDSGLELKCPALKTQVGYLLEGGLPWEYRCQVHGSMIVTGRNSWEFLSYAPGLAPLLIRTVADEFTEQLRQALEAFRAKYDAALVKIQALSAQPPPVPAIRASREQLARIAYVTATLGIEAHYIAGYCANKGWEPQALTPIQADELLAWLVSLEPAPSGGGGQ